MRAQVIGLVALLAGLGACDLLVSPESLTGGVPPPERDAGGDAGAADAGAGLVAYWPFDEATGAVARDQSGLGNDAVLKMGASWAPGRVGGALAVDGQNGYAFVDENGSLSLTTELTIAAWINLDYRAYDQRFLAKRFSYGIKLNSRYPQLEGGGNGGYAAMSQPTPPGEWHHVAFTFVRGDVRAYLDGQEVTFGGYAYDAGDTFEPWDAGLVIGGASNFDELAKGRIDELRIYARALRPLEIAELAR
jgi:hypothetical protein